LARHKQFCWANFNKIWRFSRWIWYKLCCSQAHQNIGKNMGGN